MKALDQPQILGLLISNEDIVSNIQCPSPLGNSDYSTIFEVKEQVEYKNTIQNMTTVKVTIMQ
jgi:hypothetical protein